MTALLLCRKAAYGLNHLTNELGLGNIAERFHGDNPGDWLVYNDTEIAALKDNHEVAYIIINNNHIHITITDAYLLIRPHHLSDFNPIHYGITIQTARDFKGDKLQPDLHASWEIPEDTNFHGPRVYNPTSTYTRKPNVRRSI